MLTGRIANVAKLSLDVRRRKSKMVGVTRVQLLRNRGLMQ